MTTETQAPEDLILLNTLMDDGAAMTEDRLISLRDAVVMVQQNLAFSIKEIIIRELKALPDAWQPIETAPRDGTEFQAWIVSDDDDSGHWEPKARFNPDSGIPETWGRVDYDEDDWAYTPWFILTHWMPLPEPPK